MGVVASGARPEPGQTGDTGVGAGCARRGSPPTGPSLPDSASPPTPARPGSKGQATGAPLGLSCSKAVIQGTCLTGSTSVSATNAPASHHLTNPNSDSSAVYSHHFLKKSRMAKYISTLMIE